jgi:hypothetical protein
MNSSEETWPRAIRIVPPACTNLTLLSLRLEPYYRRIQLFLMLTSESLERVFCPNGRNRALNLIAYGRSI